MGTFSTPGKPIPRIFKNSRFFELFVKTFRNQSEKVPTVLQNTSQDIPKISKKWPQNDRELNPVTLESLVISHHYWSSVIIIGHQQSSLIIDNHHSSSLIINHHHWSSLIIIDHHGWLAVLASNLPGEPAGGHWGNRLAGSGGTWLASTSHRLFKKPCKNPLGKPS